MPTQALGKCGEVYTVTGQGHSHIVECYNGTFHTRQSSSRSSQQYVARTHYENICKDCLFKLRDRVKE